jgi:response regulator RpfG family c-di-GMP phosphodiesterase
MSDERVLIVDDHETTRSLLAQQLRALGWDTVTTGDGRAALDVLSSDSIGVVLLDIDMPGLNGIDVLRRMNGYRHETPVVMVTGMDSADVIRKTLREGAYDYLVKPWDIDELKLAVGRALEHSRVLRKNKEYCHQLEWQVRDRTAAVEEALSDIKETYQETILALGSALETRDGETQRHALRVAQYCDMIAEAIGINGTAMLQNTRWGAFLHEIGKIGVSDTILRKPGPLTESEWEIMKTHPEIGRGIVANIPFLKGAVPIIYCHHERFDGTGYPRGLHGDTIPLEARIFAIADAMDAMLSDRPYRKAMDFADARESVLEQSGKQFDPDIVAVAVTIPEEKWEEEATLFG